MKNIYILTLLFFIVFASNSQTASLAKLIATPGDTVIMPVRATGFVNVGAIGFYINYDNTVLQYVSVVNVNPSISSILYNTDSIIKSAWSSPSSSSIDSLNMTDSTLLYNIKFYYTGGYSAVSFDTAGSVIADINAVNLSQNNPTAFVNGYVVEATGIKENTNSSLHLNIYPNPTTGVISIVVSPNRVINNISVFDVEGKEIYNRANIRLGSTSVDSSNSAAGVYFLKIESGNDILYRKVIRQQ